MAKQKKQLVGDVYYPSKQILKSSRVMDYDCLYQMSIEDRETFWEKEAGKLTWYKKWDKVLDDSKKHSTNGLQAERSILSPMP